LFTQYDADLSFVHAARRRAVVSSRGTTLATVTADLS
jgi:hypothetical protein